MYASSDVLRCSISFVACLTGDVLRHPLLRLQSLVLAGSRDTLGTAIITPQPHALTCQHKRMLYTQHAGLRDEFTESMHEMRGTSFDGETNTPSMGYRRDQSFKNARYSSTNAACFAARVQH